LPHIHELIGSKKTRFQLLSGEEAIMLPDGCQVLNMSNLIPRKTVPGSLSYSLDE